LDTLTSKFLFDFLIKHRTWKATLTVTGIDQLPSTDKAGNVLRPETIVKLSIRLPPTLPSKKAIEVLEKVTEVRFCNGIGFLD